MEAKEKILEAIDRVYNGLQHLELPTTKNNLAIVLDAETTMEQAYAFIKNSMTEPEEAEAEADAND